jgi:hypothetical protein
MLRLEGGVEISCVRFAVNNPAEVQFAEDSNVSRKSLDTC